MNHFFLLNEAIDLPVNTDADIEHFIEGMEALNAIQKDSEDEFQLHESIWDLPIFPLIYEKSGQRESLIISFITQMAQVDQYMQNELTYDNYYPNENNAFLGIEFAGTDISDLKQITDSCKFFLFKQDIIWDFNFRNFWERSRVLFPKLVLCGAVEQQIAQVGNSGYFNQIVERLKDLNLAAQAWTAGEFSYKAANRNFPIRISPESASTKAKYQNERMFSLPDGRREYFELHIKTGDLRFHFFPDAQTNLIYIGYIGPHLSTVTG